MLNTPVWSKDAVFSDTNLPPTQRYQRDCTPPEKVYHFDHYIKRGTPEKMADACRDLIAAESDQPFFLYFCTSEPHRPFRREGSDPVAPEDVIVPPYLPDTKPCRQELAKYYMSVQRADSGLVRLIEILKETDHWDDTLVIYISDNGIAFPGAKTTLYDPGMRLPCVVRNPYAKKHNVVTDAMVNWADITPTIYDFAIPRAAAVAVDPSKPRPKPDVQPVKIDPPKPAPKFHGRSFLSILEEEHPKGWDEVYASHTFHEITMYYPMRVVRTKKHKLIWNIAHGLEYPFASDLYASATWQDILKRDAKYYGKRTVDAYLHRPEFELYDLEKDPHEVVNRVDDKAYADVLAELQTKLKAFQNRTKDPWILKWRYE